jgi:hypothetical protein
VEWNKLPDGVVPPRPIISLPSVAAHLTLACDTLGSLEVREMTTSSSSSSLKAQPESVPLGPSLVGRIMVCVLIHEWRLEIPSRIPWASSAPAGPACSEVQGSAVQCEAGSRRREGREWRLTGRRGSSCRWAVNTPYSGLGGSSSGVNFRSAMLLANRQ